MSWQPSPYALALFISALVSGVVAVYAWRRRPTTGATPLSLFMLAATIWSLAYALELASVDLGAKVFWAKVQYFGIVSVAPLMLLIVLQYIGREQWLTRRNLILLAIVPIMTLVLVWTNGVHKLIWEDLQLVQQSPFTMLQLEHGSLFWIIVAYSYTCLLAGTILLIQSYRHVSSLYRAQTGILLAGTLVPWLANALYVLDLGPFPGLDLTPFAFTITGLVATWGLFRFRLLDIMPIARAVVIQGMSDGIIVLDAQDRVVDINPAAERIIGRAGANVIGKAASQALWAEVNLGEQYQDVQDTQTQISVGEKNDRRYYDLRISSLRDLQGQSTVRVIGLHDTTELRETEITLRKLSQAMEQSANTIVITDLEGTIEYVNPKFVESAGYSVEEALGQNPSLLKSDQQDDAYYQALWQTIASGQEWRGEFLNKRKDGSLFWEQATIAPIYDAAGQMTHYVAVKEDISERKQAEGALNKLLELNRVLATTRDMDAALTQAVTEAVKIVPGADKGTLQWLDDDGQTLGTVAFSHADNLQRTVTPFKAGVGAAGQAFVTRQIINMPDVLADERFVPGDPPAQFRSLLVAPLVVKDRSLGTLTLTSEKTGAFSSTDEALIGLIADQIAGALENANEFTARLQAEGALQQHITELQSRNEELDAFAHTVAHDLKNPASVMVGYADLLTRGHGRLSETLIIESLETISRQGRRMSTIVDELLLLASVRAMTEIEIESLEMQSIITESIVDLRFLTEEYQGEIIVPETWPVALGYAPWVGVIWTNYISNALKYGGKPPRVELGATILEDGWVQFWVHDNGNGLSPDEQARLFTPFERLHREGIKGHGLGLSIIQRIAQKLGGKVGVESEGAPGQGCVFFFTLPPAES